MEAVINNIQRFWKWQWKLHNSPKRLMRPHSEDEKHPSDETTSDVSEKDEHKSSLSPLLELNDTMMKIEFNCPSLFL